MFNLFKKVKPQEGGKSNEEVLKARQEAKEIILKANEDALRVKQDAHDAANRAQDEALKVKQEAERESRRITESAVEVEKKLISRERQVEEKDRSIDREKENVDRIKKEAEANRDAMLQKLEKLASMTKEQAKELLLNAWEDKLKADVAKRIKAAEEEVKQNVEERAKEMLVDSMKHGATDYVAEFTLSTFALPSEDFKGRIIGKDGRNIRAFELATGVDVDLEEEGVIKLSSFDAVKREVARVSLERLIRDGRIQPQRIEEIVQTVRRELDRIMFKSGEELAHKVGVYNLPTEATQALGKFKYRYSYGQNMILHTLEETKIGIALAHELHADVNVVKLGCLMHDIGKVIDSKDAGGSHVTLGVEFLKKHRFNQKVIDTVAAHHEDIPFPSVEAVIVYIADAISGGRPGARHEDFEEYLKRIKTIEDAAKTKKGVRDAYALQAGRELRVIVKPDEISDDEMTVLAQKIREDLEKKFEVFPGQIKVTIIRESRTEATTKI